jgi:hypothetical protein
VVTDLTGAKYCCLFPTQLRLRSALHLTRWMTNETAIGAILLLVASACGRPENAADAAVRECLQQGGNWQRVCISQEYACVKPFPDAGKACKEPSEWKSRD